MVNANPERSRRVSSERSRTAGQPPRDLAGYRRFFAAEIQACAGLRTPALVDAFARVRREMFLPPGPWVTAMDTAVILIFVLDLSLIVLERLKHERRVAI